MEKIVVYPDGLTRCRWPGSDQTYIDYHDLEWGVRCKDDQALFEHLCLEGFQAGLSWITILKRRESFRKAFKNFDPAKVSKLKDRDVNRLMENSAIIRNRAKILSAINNAMIVQSINEPLSEIIWEYSPRVKTPRVSLTNFEWRATSEESVALSKKLRSLGFSFVGPTTMYALMQSIGMVNDHAPGCFRRNQLKD